MAGIIPSCGSSSRCRRDDSTGPAGRFYDNLMDIDAIRHPVSHGLDGATVDQDVGSGDGAGQGRGEERDGRRCLLGLDQASDAEAYLLGKAGHQVVQFDAE
jgi:hypothetical protein